MGNQAPQAGLRSDPETRGRDHPVADRVADALYTSDRGPVRRRRRRRTTRGRAHRTPDWRGVSKCRDRRSPGQRTSRSVLVAALGGDPGVFDIHPDVQAYAPRRSADQLLYAQAGGARHAADSNGPRDRRSVRRQQDPGLSAGKSFWTATPAPSAGGAPTTVRRTSPARFCPRCTSSRT